LSNSGSSTADSIPFGDYVTTKGAAGANSIDNLAQLDDCIKNSDRACESAMVLDGRAFFVDAGTSMSGGDVGYGIFDGTVTSGALVGKKIYLPVGALK